MNKGDDVERGYYVYIHRDRATNIPFYVGKGKGRRAFDLIQRPLEWHRKVESLVDGFEIEIVEDDLSEEEAYDLERAMINKYGKLNDGTGTLLNVTDGGSLDFGEAPVLQMTIKLPPKVASAIRADYESRRYLQPTPQERRQFCEEVIQTIKELESRLEATVFDDEEETDLELELVSLLCQVRTLAQQHVRRKVSWKDFACELEDISEDVGDLLEETGEDATEEPIIAAILGDCSVFLKDRIKYLKLPQSGFDS